MAFKTIIILVVSFEDGGRILIYMQFIPLLVLLY